MNGVVSLERECWMTQPDGSESLAGRTRKREIMKLRISPWGLLTATGVIAAGATVLGFLGQFFWFFDLFSHFRVQYFVALSLLAGMLVMGREPKASAIFGLFATINLCTIVPLYLGAVPGPTMAGSSLRAMLANVNTETGQPDKVAGVIREFRPDIVVLEEINDRWLSALSAQLKSFPYSKTMPREDNFGIALYSKYPFTSAKICYLGGAEVPTVVAEIEAPAGRFTVIGTHPLPPAGAEYSRLRDEQLRHVPDVLKMASSPVLLLGDLNATPWCSAFRRLLRESGLVDSSQGRGVQPSWPTFMPLLLIPIDQCLHSPGIQVTRKTIGPKVGSDHYPVVVDFALSNR